MLYGEAYPPKIFLALRLVISAISSKLIPFISANFSAMKKT